MRVPLFTGNPPNTASNNTTRTEQHKWRPHKGQERHWCSITVVGMGMPGGTMERIRAAADGEAAEVLACVADQRRAENIAAASVVRSVHALSELRIAAELEIHQSGDGDPDVTYARRAAECEAAVALSLSRVVTRDIMTVGEQLACRLPAIEKAFADGDLDYPRVRAIALVLRRACDNTVSALEQDIAAAALRCNVKSLRERIWKSWFAHDAQEAAAAQKSIVSDERCAGIRRGDDGTATLIAKMTTLEGAECSAMLDELVGTVCSHDPRTKRQLRGFALLALVHREDHITCTCSRDDCPVRSTQDRSSARRTPLMQVMVDIETLLGLTSNPATLADGTVLDPEVARHIAGDARWQMFLTEMLDAARSHLGQDDTQGPHEDPHDEDLHDEDPHDQEPHDPDPDDPELGSSSPAGPAGPSRGPRARRLLRRGKVRPAATVPAGTAAERRPSSDTGVETALCKAMADFLRAAKSDPALTLGLHPDGHGGFVDPPPGAMKYRPSAELAALVRASYCTCTFPGCGVPSAACELDHIVPFDHTEPAAGGWTILSNLQPLCKFHHQAKTMKLWSAAQLEGGLMYWASTSGLRRITPAESCAVTMNDDGTGTGTDNITDPTPDTDGPPQKRTRRQTSSKAGKHSTPHEPPAELYEPTWWEANICDTDSSWSHIRAMTGPVAGGSMRIPSLGEIARITDPQQRADMRFLREKFLEHRAVIAARDRYRPPPF